MINLLASFRTARVAEPLFRHDDLHHAPSGAAVFADGILSGLLSVSALPPCRE